MYIIQLKKKTTRKDASDKHNIWRSLERRSWKNQIPGKVYFREILKGTNSNYTFRRLDVLKENLHPAYIPFAFSKEMVKVNILSKKIFFNLKILVLYSYRSTVCSSNETHITEACVKYFNPTASILFLVP